MKRMAHVQALAAALKGHLKSIESILKTDKSALHKRGPQNMV